MMLFNITKGAPQVWHQKANVSNKGQNKHKWEMSTNDNKGKLLALKGECTLWVNHFSPIKNV
jgi:hypothetical protein